MIEACSCSSVLSLSSRFDLIKISVDFLVISVVSYSVIGLTVIDIKFYCMISATLR